MYLQNNRMINGVVSILIVILVIAIIIENIRAWKRLLNRAEVISPNLDSEVEPVRIKNDE